MNDGQCALEEATHRALYEVYFLANDNCKGKRPPSYACWLAVLFRTRQSSRPEDKVFGLAGLVDGFDNEIINYGTSVGVVYENFMKHMIKTSQTLASLSQVVHPYTAPLDKSNRAVAVAFLPSWVANFGAHISPGLSEALPHRHKNLYLYNTSGGKDYEGSTASSALLVVRGVPWDAIASVGEALDDIKKRANAATYRSWHKMALTEFHAKNCIEGDALENAFARTLCTGLGSWRRSRATKKMYCRVYDLWWRLVEGIQDLDAEAGADPLDSLSTTEEVVNFDMRVFQSTCCRRFFISEKGYMGLAPAMAEPGDRIAVLFGGKVPYILRKNESESPGTTWTFIGDSYVHGIMDGEVIERLEKGEVESELITLK